MEKTLITALVAGGAQVYFINLPLAVARATRPREFGEDSGRLVFNRFAIASYFLPFAGATGFGLFLAFFADKDCECTLVIGLIVAVIFGYLTSSTLASYFPVADIIWTKDGIEAPGKMFWLPHRKLRSRLGWGEIEKIKQSNSNVLILYGPDGTKLYLSAMYSGFDRLRDLIKERRPDLFEPRPGRKWFGFGAGRSGKQRPGSGSG